MGQEFTKKYFSLFAFFLVDCIKSAGSSYLFEGLLLSLLFKFIGVLFFALFLLSKCFVCNDGICSHSMEVIHSFLVDAQSILVV